MPAVRYEHTGNAVPTTLSAGIAAGTTSIPITSASGWPSGSTGPFWVTIDRGNASEEKVLVLSRSGTTLTVSARGADGTSAVSHSINAAIEHTISATEVDDANRIAVEIDALGTVVGLTETQTLTGKTISADNNTLSGIAASSFVLSNASGNIDGAAAQKAVPAGVVVGTTDAQTLTNKTLTTPVVDQFGAASGLGAGWTAWTPALSNITVGNGTLTTLYKQVGKVVHFRFSLLFGTTSAIGSGSNFSLPSGLTPVASIVQAGSAVFVDSSDGTDTGIRSGGCYITSGAPGFALPLTSTGRVNGTVPFTWAVNDILSVCGTYEAA